MFCSTCGRPMKDGDRFCSNCGAPLQAPGAVMPSTVGRGRQPRMAASPPNAPNTSHRAIANKPKNPYRDQIAQLRLQLRQLKLQLRELNQQIRGTRTNYFEFGSFVQRGPMHNIGRMIEGVQLFGPYQQRKQMQNQVMQLEQQLLSLEQAQEQWRLQQQYHQEG